MSANKRRRSNSHSHLLQHHKKEQQEPEQQLVTADQIATVKEHSKLTADDGMLLEMPRVCRCCCKGEMELLSLFEFSNETAESRQAQQKQSPLPVRQRRKTTTANIQEQQLQQQEQQQQQQHQRKSDNPVDYALSGAHSSMDTVLEEMFIWMLNISRDDGLPQEICRQCKAQFIMVAKFRRRCIRVQQRLHEQSLNIAERKRISAQQQEQSANESRLLSATQLERKRRLVSGVESPQLESEGIQSSTDTASTSPPHKLRRLQLRVQNMRTNDSRVPAKEIETETTTKTLGDNAVETKSVLRKTNNPWKTKAARKQIMDNWSSCSTDSFTLVKSAKDSSTKSSESDTDTTETSTTPVQSSPERISDLSVASCRGFESDSANSATMSSTIASRRSPNAKLSKYPRSPKKSLAVLRRGQRVRAIPNYAPVKRARRVFRKSPTKPTPHKQTGVSLADSSAPVKSLPKLEQCTEQTTSEPKEDRAQEIHTTAESPNSSCSSSVVEPVPPSRTVETSMSSSEEIVPNSAVETSMSSSEEIQPSNSNEVTSSAFKFSEAPNEKSVADRVHTQSRLNEEHETLARISSNGMETVNMMKELETLRHHNEQQKDTIFSPFATIQNEDLSCVSEEPQTERLFEQLERLTKEVKEELSSGVRREIYDKPESPDSMELSVSQIECTKSELVLSTKPQISVCCSSVEPQRQSELVVSIPLDILGNELQRKLCITEPEHEVEDEHKDINETDDVNNNGNAENFCQSATAVSFNSAVALTTKPIEAEPDGGGGQQQPVADDIPSLQQLVAIPLNVDEEQQRQRAAEDKLSRAYPMDFLAEFEKHCEKTLKLQSTRATLELGELEVAKQQLEVEMNDVASTLHGILNEMQDEHLYTPVCAPIDEFLTPADYTPLPEVVAPMPNAGQAPTAQQMYMSNMTPQQQQQHAKDGNLFDSSSFSNELIGFQNDVPCFENIEATIGSAVDQQSLQHELTTLFSDFQPIQQEQPQQQQQHQPQQQPHQPQLQQQQQLQVQQLQAAHHQQQQQQQQQQQLHQLQPEPVSYETLYQPATPAATVASPLMTSNSSKLQLIQMPAQETMQWQTEANAATQQATHLQWSTVGGLETIKTMPVTNLDGTLDGSAATTTTTYYINASDLYQATPTGESYAVLDNNENYVLDQQHQQQQQHHQLQTQSQQPIMILIQQPEMQQPVASASNPQQAPLHISYAPPLSNELHAYQQQQQQAQLQQHTQQHTQQQQQLHTQQHVQNHTVLGQPTVVTSPSKGRPPMLKCRFCQNGPRFMSSLEYSRHIIELHPADAPFTCPHCPLSFPGRSKRNQHIVSHHLVQQFHCGQCSQIFPAQRALDLHLQRFHMPCGTDATANAATAAAAAGVCLEDVQLQMTNNEQQQQSQQSQPALELQTSLTQPRRTRILCCPDCEDCTSGHAHDDNGQQQEQQQQQQQHEYEEVNNLQTPPMVLTPPSTIASLPSPQPPSIASSQQQAASITPLPFGTASSSSHISLPSPEQSEPDSTTATLRQFRKRCMASGTPATPNPTNTMFSMAASPSPSSSPSSSTMETVATLQLGKLRGSHPCVVCEKRFTNVISLRKHQQLAHDSQTTMPWVCSICKRGYRKRTDMDNHMKSHEPKGRPYECNECWVRFPEFKQLAMHKFTVHELIKPHTCDECGKQFGTESALKTHIKFHGERGFQCEECDAAFAYVKDLRKHRRTHNSELFYKCDLCPRTFLHFTSHRAHMNTHLPMGVFLNDKTAVLPGKLESPATPMTNEELQPLTPLSNCTGNIGSCGSNNEDYPGSVEMVESSMVPSLEMSVATP